MGGRRISKRTAAAAGRRHFPDAHGPIQAEAEPYRRLWAAVMAQALWDLQRTVEAQQTGGFFLYDPIGWFRSDEEHIGSFVWVCLVMGLIPDATRERIGGMFKLSLGSDGDEHGHEEIRTLGKMREKQMGTRRGKKRRVPNVRKSA